MEKLIPVYIPIRNEVKNNNLPATIESLRKAAIHAGVTLKILVVNDGSTDESSALAQKYADHVVDLENRGFSALGRPELADTHTTGLQKLRDFYPELRWIMVSGSDAIYNEDYFDHILKVLEEDKNVMVTGGIRKQAPKSAPNTVTGSGRFYRRELLEFMEFALPNFYSWESYPLYFSRAKGYTTYEIESAVFNTTRPHLGKVNWANYGIGMFEGGFILFYVMGRTLRRFLLGHPKQGIQLLKGWFIAHFTRRKYRYPKFIRKDIKKYQWKRILYYLSAKKINLFK